MKRFGLLIFLAIATAIMSCSALSVEAADPIPHSAERFPVKVLWIYDGDTIKVRQPDGTEAKVRYEGIDAPELNPPDEAPEPWSIEAADANRTLVEGRTVLLELDERRKDKYGRMLAYVFVDGLFVNAELVRKGYARVRTYPPNIRHRPGLLAAQREARRNRKGIWESFSGHADVLPKNTPGEARPSTAPSISGEQEHHYVASLRSKVFHRPSCPNAKEIKPKNLLSFSTFGEAERSGRRKCKTCFKE